MIAFVVRIGCSFLLLVLVASVLSCSLLARLYVPEGEPVLGGIAPDHLGEERPAASMHIGFVVGGTC